jgi:4-hydroxy-tetrahydrodipicolinate synthase
MLTPSMDEDSDLVSLPRTRQLAGHLQRTGTTGIVVCGTTGESFALSEHERSQVLYEVLSTVDGQIPLIAGTSTYNTRESIELSRRAKEEGASGILLVSPAYYCSAPPEGVERHFARILDAVELPAILYNVPSRTNGKNITPEVVFRLAEQYPHVVGLKEARGTGNAEDREYVDRELRERPDNFTIWSGNDADTLYFLQRGGYGVVSVASHLVGREIESTINLYREGEHQAAADLDGRLQPLYAALFPPTSPVASPAAVKAMLNIAGVEVGGLRSPLIEVPESYRNSLRELLSGYSLVENAA